MEWIQSRAFCEAPHSPQIDGPLGYANNDLYPAIWLDGVRMTNPDRCAEDCYREHPSTLNLPQCNYITLGFSKYDSYKDKGKCYQVRPSQGRICSEGLKQWDGTSGFAFAGLRSLGCRNNRAYDLLEMRQCPQGYECDPDGVHCIWMAGLEAPTSGYAYIGKGYCNIGYEGADRTGISRSECNAKCTASSTCNYVALLPSKTCSLYKENSCPLETTSNLALQHITFKKDWCPDSERMASKWFM